MEMDWAEWLRSWEAQQDHLMPLREERFAVMASAVRVHCGDAARVLDLGSGPGSLAMRIVRSIPAASVLALDRDPVLLEVGRRALHGEPRIRFAPADLGDPALPSLGRDFDAAVSTTALHWLDLASLRSLYQSLATMLRPGGLFLNGDRLVDPESDLDRLAAAVRRAQEQDQPAEGPSLLTWEGWWRAAEAEPGLAPQFAERRQLRHDHPEHGEPPSRADHERALREAGFRSVGTLWQYLDGRVLAAIR